MVSLQKISARPETFVLQLKSKFMTRDTSSNPASEETKDFQWEEKINPELKKPSALIL